MKVATSILNCDFNKLEEEIKKISTSDYLHLDVMDGHFVPNISFGYPVLKNLKNITNISLDSHLMIENPYDYIDDFEKIGSKIITIHIEANKPIETIKRIKNKGIKAGISLKPNTKIEELLPVLETIDLVLVMTVEPGFGGQTFMKEQMKKVEYLAKLREKHGYKYVIQVDGGINDETIDFVRNTGVDIVVAGTYITKSKNPKKAIESLRWK